MAKHPLPALRRRILAWYATSARDLPWRATRDPYRIWVSEIMLQQTQVETVIPYYRRFLRAFPTLKFLASADIDDVLKCWEHLGYYARARNLHKAAGIVLRENGGRLPKTADALAALPGVGRYTAAAIASIAFGQDAAALDGNIRRVLCRLFRIQGDTRDTKIQQQLWALAAELLPLGRAGDFNQALMDLGATICTPRSPACARCPVARHCQARRHMQQDELPKINRKKPVPHYRVAVGIVHGKAANAGRILMAKRKADALLGGLWEFPGGKIKRGEKPADAAAREIREEIGIEVQVGPRAAVVRHAYSHFRVTIEAFHCKHTSGRPRAIACKEIRWLRPPEIRHLAIPKASDKIFKALGRLPLSPAGALLPNSIVLLSCDSPGRRR
ncbi:MAG: A/G-specific adenine glycosylase [Planctomycetaceae bacterium]|nr:A/G-specific adenine glycosylase [Planctomycetaceae bacterium]